MTIKALKGFKDILPDEAGIWQRLERTARDIFHRFGFSEIRVPILEKTDLFSRSIGEATDIVEKEMYSFTDRNGASVTLRPEGTAPILRAFIENGLQVRQPVQRLYTIGPMFRRERPQKGRLRQFHQMSAEVIGSDHPMVDAEIMAMARLLLKEFGLTADLEINSLGCPRCRPAYKEALTGFLEKHAGRLCPDCERRRHTNPLRVLDCKSEHCREYYKKAPSVLKHLCADCDGHFKATREGLDLLNIPYTVNPSMVRGLDYYTRTTFELITGSLGAQSAVGAGGRYDGLLGQLDGPDLPGIGFAMGLDRLVLMLAQNNMDDQEKGSDLFLALLGEGALTKGFVLAQGLRTRGLRVGLDHEGRSLKSQLKQAARAGARFTLIIGAEEMERNEAILREMANGGQEMISLPEDPEPWYEIMAEKIGRIS